ncbi:MAG TPA: hypothetical protein VG711_06625, partial [Phycisphaerales bacterium]|nr:hypothetical protein [Phycisphaerales bacterium]
GTTISTQNEIQALVEYGGELFVGGYFKTINGESAIGITRWDGTNWHNFSPGLGPADGIDTEVTGAVVYNGDLIIGGKFTSVDGVAANGIARWDGKAWHAMGGGVQGTNGNGPAFVREFAEFNGNLYVGGYFLNVDGQQAENLAMWDGTTWHAIVPGANDYVTALSVHQNKLYAGGYFTTIAGVSANHVAVFDGVQWESLDGGISCAGCTPYASAFQDLDGRIAVGGSFTKVNNSIAASRIALWNECPFPNPAADINGDGHVNIDDLTAVILNWGACDDPCPPCPADIAPAGKGDCTVNIDDLTMVILSWQP